MLPESGLSETQAVALVSAMTRMMMKSQSKSLSVGCLFFSEDDLSSLRCLLGLLEPSLKMQWSMIQDAHGRADLWLINLDHPDARLPDDGRRLVGCTRKPREQSQSCIHRPLRAAGVLAALSDVEDTLLADTASKVSTVQNSTPSAASDRFRLRAWPTELSGWPRPWWGVLAALTRQHRSVEEISITTRLEPDEIIACLNKLRAEGLVECLPGHRQTSPSIPMAVAGWRNLISKVGQRLGFSA